MQYNDVLSRMPSITLNRMDAVKLLSRIDTKYLTEESTLRMLLEQAAALGYMVFEDGGNRIQEYRSMYYDTPNLQMYMDHQNRRLVRQKLRTRCYVVSGVTFLELKSKNNHGRTKKKRMQISSDRYFQNALDDSQQLGWLAEKFTYPATNLTPSLETSFSRITLVNPELTERTTIDTNLFFRNLRTETCANMGPIAVIEVKQDGNMNSRLRDILLNLRVKPVRISKYCIGTAMTAHDIKCGRFKKKIMLINKMKEEYERFSKHEPCGE